MSIFLCFQRNHDHEYCEEDIEEIIWVKPDAWLQSGVAVYPNIREVIMTGMSVDG